MGVAGYDRATPNAEFPGGIERVPNVLTEYTNRVAFLFQIHVANDTDKDCFFRVEDGDGHAIIPSEIIPARKSNLYWWDHGIRCDAGFSWMTDCKKLDAEVFGYY